MFVKLKMSNNKKSILFLFGLLSYVLIVISFSNTENFVETSYANVASQGCLMEVLGRDTTIEWGQIAAEEKNDSQTFLQSTLAGGKVGRCAPVVHKLPLQLFCGSTPPGNIDAWRIRAPAVLFAGAEAPFDNLVQVNNPTGQVAFRNAAEIIDPQNDYLITQPPPEELKQQPVGDGIKKNPFQMHFAIQKANVHTEDLKFDSLEKSICPHVVNGGQFNVRASNLLQEDLTLSVSPPGLMAFGDRDYTGMICGSSRAHRIDLNANESFLLCPKGSVACPCLSCPPPIQTIFLMDAPLGSGEICKGNASDCATRYWEAGRILTNPPIPDMEEYKLYPEALGDYERENDYIVDDPIILTTPCVARIGCLIYEGPCIWDVSIWQHVYDLEQIFTYPGYEQKKEKDVYWEEVERELKRRGG